MSQKSLSEERAFAMWRSQFGLFQDEDGLWRCGGRLGNAANISESTRHPILLSVRHHLTKLRLSQDGQAQWSCRNSCSVTVGLLDHQRTQFYKEANSSVCHLPTN